MRSILEKAIVHLLNGDQDKAETLFHKFMVEKARQIHESLRQGDDVELKENWDSEISEEEYFDDPELEHDGEGEEGMPDANGMDVGDTDTPAMGDEMGDEMDMEGDDEFDTGDNIEGMEGDIEGQEEGLGDKIDNLEGKIEELTAEFDRMMAKLEDTDADDLDADAMGDEEGFGDEGDGLGDEDMDIEDEGDLDLGGEEGGEAEMGGEDTHDIADRMEDDMGDEHQPEHEMAEDSEMLEDITESVLAELDKISTPAMGTEGKEIGSGGKTVSGQRSSMLPNHSVNDRWQQAKPYLIKAEGDAHNDSFERETAPTNKTVEKRRNNDAGVKKLTKVPDKGDSSALINSDFAGGRPSTRSITDGKPSK